MVSGKIKSEEAVDALDPTDALGVVKARVEILGVELCDNINPVKTGKIVGSIIEELSGFDFVV